MIKLFASLFLSTIYIYSMGQSTEKIQFADNIVVAHRGAWKANNLPQNSLASLKLAIDMKCTGSEFDVRMTKDEVLVVVHDDTHNSALVEESTYDEIVEELLSNGETLPTLKETFLAGMRDNSNTGLIVEIKPSQVPNRGELIATKIMELIDEVGVDPYIHTFISFDYDILLKILSINPNAKTEYLNGEKTPSELAADGISGLDYHYKVYKNNPSWISEAKALDLTLNVWTVNKRKDLEYFIENGFDCISTDEPERLFKLLQKY